MKLCEEQLYRAASIADAMELYVLPDKETCPEHRFSEQFENDMRDLLLKVAKNEIVPYHVPRGWQFYTKRGAAVILLAFLLTCAVMPDVVMAGYQKFIEIIEKNVVTEYTEYQYESKAPAGTKTVPFVFEYLPEGMVETERIIKERRVDYYFECDDKYLDIAQKLLTEEDGMTILLDTEGAELETRYIGSEEVELILEDGVYMFVWLHDSYHIKGDTNLSADEIMKILNNLRYEE